jgi:hypothetical protein
VRRGAAIAVAIALAVDGLMMVHARVGLAIAGKLLREGDLTRDLLAWDAVANSVRKYREEYPTAHVVGARWIEAAKLAHALGPGVPVTAVGEDPRGFRLLTDQSQLLGRDLLLASMRGPHRREAMIAYAPYCRRIRALETVAVRRGWTTALVSLYHCQGLRARIPERTSPR